jgi:PAS domain S-box-containing protein
MSNVAEQRSLVNQQSFQQVSSNSPEPIPIDMRRIEDREWWLWGFAVAVILVLTLGIVSFTFPWFGWDTKGQYWFDLREWVRGLAALVLLFNVYTLYQHLQLYRIRRQLAERDQLFQLISENAVDMIALVDSSGRRLYNSPAYQKVLGYSPEELKNTSSFLEIHPDDRLRVVRAAEKALQSGCGGRMEYRIRHRNGSWRTLESTASPIRNAKGEIDKLVIVNRDITERKRAEELAVYNTFHDSLTALPNRTLFLDRLQHALALSKRHSNYKFAVLLVDVDGFKIVNDSLGHQAGDNLLIKIGQRLEASVRQNDTVSRAISDTPYPHVNDPSLARLGGDEFAILLEDVKDPIAAVRVADRLQKDLEAPFAINQEQIVISASIGIASSITPDTQTQDLVRDADIAMHRAKRAGKGRCEVFDTAMYAGAVKRLTLEGDLRKALERGEFRVYYQPIVALQTGEIVGFEALTRWQRPQGILSPGEFIAVAEETGLIIPMNRLLLREACRCLRLWQLEFPCTPPLTMSVNMTAQEFAQPSLTSEVLKALRETGVDPSYLRIEISETIAMGDAEKSSPVLAQLTALGVRFSVDDFGTGYSSLSRLRRIPVDTLKIDRAFIANVDSDRENLEVVRAIIALAHNLGLKVVAEGTETEQEVKQLQQLNCEMAQGYFFSRPADDQAMLKLLARNRNARDAAVGR